jgi:FixJ family two-component response regulator
MVDAKLVVCQLRGVRATMQPDTTIFLVEDDAAVRDSLKLALETYGYRVRDFASSAEFLRSGASREKSCLVLDLHMPEISGLELVERLIADKPAPPAVLITGRADEAVRRRARAVGVFAVIEKPFDTALLMRAMDRAMEAAGATWH